VKKHSEEVWAQLILSKADSKRIREFLKSEFCVRPENFIPRMHLTVYHARRPMESVKNIQERVHIEVSALDTRFMVLAPGGENPRPGLDPCDHKVGIRIQRKSEAYHEILKFRQRLIVHETRNVLGRRRPSTEKRNAFGARAFQPHVALLRSGSEIPRDLKQIGTAFREKIGKLVFDRFVVHISDVATRISSDVFCDNIRPCEAATNSPH
jgi:hypothetical protein